jgi:predicted PurR-regulated permease PerM
MLKLELSYRGIIVIIATILAVWTLTELWAVLILVLTSFILMVGLLPFVDALARRGVPRNGAVLLILAFVLALIAGLVALMAPPMIDEFRDVQANLPQSAHELEEVLMLFGVNVELEERARDFDWNSLVSGRAAFDAGQRVLTTTLSIVTIIVMTAYLLADSPRLARFAGQFIADDRKEEAERLAQSMSRVVGGYLRGQLITSLAIGFFVFVLLRIVGGPNPLAFAVLAAFADVIPLVGAFIATVPPVAATLQESSTKAIIVLVALLAYQQFEDRYLVPRVYGRTLNLPPIIVLFAVLAGAELLGITGVLLALPLTAAARVALDFIMENRRLPLVPTDQPLAPDSPSRSPRRQIGSVSSRRARSAPPGKQPPPTPAPSNGRKAASPRPARRAARSSRSSS